MTNGSGFDEDAHIARLDTIAAGFSDWVAPRLPATDNGEIVSNLRTFLDWRSNDRPRMNQLSVVEAEEYLLAWCPRRLSYPPEAWLGVLEAVRLWVEFLQATNQWGGGLATSVVQRLESIEPEFLDAMGDPSKFGMAKSMFMGPALGGPGLDLDDPASIQAAMEAFNELPYEVRKELTDGGIANMVPQPPVIDLTVGAIPDRASVEGEALASLAFTSVEAVRDYLGAEGKPLTKLGNPKLADVRAIAQLLEVEGATAEERAERLAKLRSADDLDHFQFMIEAGVMAAAIERTKKVLRPVEDWRLADPVEQVEDLFGAMVELGPVFSRIDLDSPVTDFAEDGLAHWMARLMAGDEVDVDQLVLEGLDVVNDMAESGQWPHGAAPFWFEQLVEYSLDPVVRCGLVKREGQRLSITDLGRVVMKEFVEANGYRLVSVDSFADADASAVITAADSMSIEQIASLWEAWRVGDSAEMKASAIVAALPSSQGPSERSVAFVLLDHAGAAAGKSVETLLHGPLAGHALRFLDVHGLLDDERTDAVTDASLAGPMIDMLAMTLDDEPELFMSLWETMRAGVHDLPRFIDDMWRVDFPETAEVLEALGRAEPDKALAKALRKAAFKRRSAST